MTALLPGTAGTAGTGRLQALIEGKPVIRALDEAPWCLQPTSGSSHESLRRTSSWE